ncbi:MAG TPA: toll/interleukin-1 receptor domain-containing protein [Thermoanaerobaculia bacterium]|nr:toll/interleukin-1 receptor domain-containing protein [Thermoanaerobaculia bacterium]
MPGPTVFLSYSHQDRSWQERLTTMLAPLVRTGAIEFWWDGHISAGGPWREEIDGAMASARVAVLLVSAPFLASDFINTVELPYFVEAARRQHVTLLWVPVSPCLHEHTPLAEIQAAHNPARPLNTLSEAECDVALKEICKKIHAAGGDQKPSAGHRPAPRLDLTRLPTTSLEFVGREAELARLDAAWEDPGIHIVTLVAFGGVGKSALVSRWLDRRAAAGWPGVRRALDWSFYSQGTGDRVTSADRFLDHALTFFGDPDPTAGSPRDRGLRLADLVRREKTLLILDGVEPLQHPKEPLAGRLKDPGLAALLKSLAAENPGLCLVTTREHIADLNNFAQTAPQWDLEHLTPEAGADLLRRLGVEGKDSELLAASKEMGGHALALTLLGNYLRRACGGDVRRRKEVDLGDAAERQGGHAFRVIQTFSRWLGEGPEVAILCLLGLFDRPADAEALAALRAKPAIPGLTETLVDISTQVWSWAISSLQEHSLLLPPDPHRVGVLDAHPLVRAYFQEELEKERPEAWREGNLRLYEFLKDSAPELPETLEAMEPLFTAVIHGCRAGRQQEAMEEVYGRRILRGNEHFSWRKLGSFGSDLTALSGFFDHPWDRPSTSLTPAAQAFVLSEAGFDLRALGRLAEAVQPMQAGLKAYIAQERFEFAARVASNLSELTLTLGEVPRAVAFGEQSVELADRSGDAFQRIVSRAKRADALHQAGRWEESAETFREAETMQAEQQSQYPRLTSLQGYRYCDLLLSRAEPEDGPGLVGLATNPEQARRFREACREVRERAGEAIKIAERNHWLLDIALNNLSLGRAHLGLALTAPAPATPGEEAEAELARSAEHLDRAVEGLRQSGNEDDLPRGLLARAAFRRLRGNLAGAKADLDEALEIAERGSMRLHACDAHLEWARLCLQQGNAEAARGHVGAARKIVEETGYGRRGREVGWLERRVT